MGFGLLFVGYLFLVMIPFGPGFTLACVGYLIMTAALGRLKDYEPLFGYARYPAVLLVPLSLADTLAGFFPAFFGAGMTRVLSVALCVATALFHLLLLLAMARILRDVEQPLAARRVTILLVCNLLYFAGMAVINLRLFTVSAKLLVMFDCAWNLLLLFNSFRIFHCYRTICPEGMENDPGFLPSGKGGL